MRMAKHLWHGFRYTSHMRDIFSKTLLPSKFKNLVQVDSRQDSWSHSGDGTKHWHHNWPLFLHCPCVECYTYWACHTSLHMTNQISSSSQKRNIFEEFSTNFGKNYWSKLVLDLDLYTDKLWRDRDSIPQVSSLLQN